MLWTLVLGATSLFQNTTCFDTRARYQTHCCGAPEETTFRTPCFDGTSTKHGGTLYVYDATTPSTQWSAVVNLGQLAAESPLARCRPAKTPHMVLPSPKYGLVGVSYTADTTFHILDATTRQLVDCIETPAAGGKIHTGTWHVSASGAMTLHLVDMTGTIDGKSGGGLHKYAVDSAGHATYVASVSMHMDDRATKPIAAGGQEGVDTLLVTDAKGGAHFVDVPTMTVVDRIAPEAMGQCAGGGGLWVYPHPDAPSRVIAQYGRQTRTEATSCLFEVDLQTRTLVQSIFLPVGSVDAHGLSFCRANGELYMLNTNRVSGTFDSVRYSDGQLVVHNVSLNAVLAQSSMYELTPTITLSNLRYEDSVVTYDHTGLVLRDYSNSLIVPDTFPEGHVHVYLAPEFAPQPTHAAYKLGRSYDGTFTVSDEVRMQYTNTRVRLTVVAMTNKHHMYTHDGVTPISESMTFQMLGFAPRAPPVPSTPPAPPNPPPSEGGMRRRLDDGTDVSAFVDATLQPDVHSYRDGRIYVVGRGPSPLSAVAVANRLPSAIPGLFTFTITDCTSVSVDVSDTVVAADDAHSVHTAPDPHGGDFVGAHEFWLIDQSGSGHGVDCASDPSVSTTYLDAVSL